ncbi:Putative RING-H2 finger protein ATL19 [Linum perenne]
MIVCIIKECVVKPTVSETSAGNSINGIPTLPPTLNLTVQQQRVVVPPPTATAASPEAVTGQVVKFKNWVFGDCKEELDEEKGGGGRRMRDEKECSICLEEFKGEEECRVLKVCEHIYHRVCIDLWLNTENHCPLCRGSVRRGCRNHRLDGVEGNHIDRV